MMVSLILLSLALLAAIVYLNYVFYNDRKRFRTRIKTLEDFILQISREQHLQNNQLQLSDELRQKLKMINATLSNDIFDLNYELFDILSKNDLLKK